MISSLIAYLRRHHIGLLALLVALGGTAYAANTVGSRDVKDNSLRSKDIKNDKIKGRDIQDGSIKGVHVDESTLSSQIVRASVVAEGPEKVFLGNAVGVRAAERTGVGEFELTLDSAEAPGCAIALTPITIDGTEANAGGSIAVTVTNGATVKVVLRDSAGTPIDLGASGVFGFFFLAAC